MGAFLAPEQKTFCRCRQPLPPAGEEDMAGLLECGACGEVLLKGWPLAEPLDSQLPAQRYHHSCVGVSGEASALILEYRCDACAPVHGSTKSKRKSPRAKKAVANYAEDAAPADQLRYTNIVLSKAFARERFQRVAPGELRARLLASTGFLEPLIVEEPDCEALRMRVPGFELTGRKVAELCKKGQMVNVLDVATQEERTMSLDKWAEYFDNPASRQRILNVISLEVGTQPLGREHFQRPAAVRKLDWIDRFWPSGDRDRPNVQVYCLMGVKDSYTDFHVDFGGTSVFYHILRGEKVFYFIPPTEQNLRKYEKWSRSSQQADRFFGDEVKECLEVRLTAGNTMLIPSGWIHAVRTPQDSVVIGGNFVHGLAIEKQARIFDLENSTNVPSKFRFPHFIKLHYYAAFNYYHILNDAPEKIKPREFDQLAHLIRFVQEHLYDEHVSVPEGFGTLDEFVAAFAAVYELRQSEYRPRIKRIKLRP